MKHFRTAILIAGILVAGLAYSSVAQTTDDVFVKKEQLRKHTEKSLKHDLKRISKLQKHELKRDLKHKIKKAEKMNHKAEARAFKGELKQEAAIRKVEEKVHKAKLHPHDKFKDRKYKEKL